MRKCLVWRGPKSESNLIQIKYDKTILRVAVLLWHTWAWPKIVGVPFYKTICGGCCIFSRAKKSQILITDLCKSQGSLKIKFKNCPILIFFWKESSKFCHLSQNLPKNALIFAAFEELLCRLRTMNINDFFVPMTLNVINFLIT